jgi:hypothetical protein
VSKKDIPKSPKTAAEWYKVLYGAINTSFFTGLDFRPDGMKIIRAIRRQAKSEVLDGRKQSSQLAQ